MSKKIEMAREQGKQIAFNKMQKNVAKDIELLEDALKIANNDTQLAFHIEKLKEFANKYCGCAYDTHTNDFHAMSIPKFADALKRVAELQKTEIIEENREETQPDGEEKQDAVVVAEVEEKPKQEKQPRRRGKGWHKEVVDGKEQIVYEKDMWRTRNCFDEKITGVLHTYQTLMGADDPMQYLDNIQIGDKIRYIDKTTKQIKTNYVISINRLKKAFSPNHHYFYMQGNDKISHKDFA